MFQGLQSELMRLQEHSHQVLLRLTQFFQSVALMYMVLSNIPLYLILRKVKGCGIDFYPQDDIIPNQSSASPDASLWTCSKLTLLF